MKKFLLLALFLCLCVPVYAAEQSAAPNWHDVGIEYFQAGNYEMAIEAFSQAMQQDPDEAIHHQYHRGSAYAVSHQSKQALADLLLAEKTYPCFFWLHYYKYLAYLDLKAYKQAGQACEQMIKIKPASVYGHHGLGCLALEKGDFITALRHTSKAVRLGPNAASYSNLAAIYRELQEYELAVKYFDKAIALDKDYYVLYFNKAMLLEKLGKNDEALACYRTFLAKIDNPDLYHTTVKKEKLAKQAKKSIARLEKTI